METTSSSTLHAAKHETDYKKYRPKHGLASKQLTGKTPVVWTFGDLCASYDELRKEVGV